MCRELDSAIASRVRQAAHHVTLKVYVGLFNDDAVAAVGQLSLPVSRS